MDLKEKSYGEIIGRPVAEYQSQLGEQPINGTPRGPFQRFSSDYVFRETKRAVDGVAGSNTRICAGLGIDVQDKNSAGLRSGGIQGRRERVGAVYEPCGYAAGEFECGGGDATGAEVGLIRRG